MTRTFLKIIIKYYHKTLFIHFKSYCFYIVVIKCVCLFYLSTQTRFLFKLLKKYYKTNVYIYITAINQFKQSASRALHLC